MLPLKSKMSAGFTLVEIMIVVAIIALLAAMAVPGFVRARKRSQATVVLNDARVLEAAKDQYANETVQPGSGAVTSAMLTSYLAPGTRIYIACQLGVVPTDVVGGSYSFSTFDNGIRVDVNTESNFTDVVDNSSAFWGSYYQ